MGVNSGGFGVPVPRRTAACHWVGLMSRNLALANAVCMKGGFSAKLDDVFVMDVCFKKEPTKAGSLTV
jgi:hypothetical protein